MIIYEVWYRDYQSKTKGKLGELIERRTKEREEQDGLKWARKVFGIKVIDKFAIFVRKRTVNVEVSCGQGRLANLQNSVSLIGTRYSRIPWPSTLMTGYAWRCNGREL